MCSISLSVKWCAVLRKLKCFGLDLSTVWYESDTDLICSESNSDELLSGRKDNFRNLVSTSFIPIPRSRIISTNGKSRSDRSTATCSDQLF